jgi:hypothetical protein
MLSVENKTRQRAAQAQFTSIAHFLLRSYNSFPLRHRGLVLPPTPLVLLFFARGPNRCLKRVEQTPLHTLSSLIRAAVWMGQGKKSKQPWIDLWRLLEVEIP